MVEVSQLGHHDVPVLIEALLEGGSLVARAQIRVSAARIAHALSLALELPDVSDVSLGRRRTHRRAHTGVVNK
jgi:hypothetical protein